MYSTTNTMAGSTAALEHGALPLLDPLDVQQARAVVTARCRLLSQRNTPEQLIEKAATHIRRGQHHARLALRDFIEAGSYLEALALRSRHGTFIEQVEAQLDISRSTASLYRRIARHGPLLLKEPEREVQSLRQAIEKVRIYEFAEEQGEADAELEEPINPDALQARRVKAATVQAARDTMGRSLERAYKVAREHRYEVDPNETIEAWAEMLERVKRLFVRHEVIEAHSGDEESHHEQW